MREVAAVTEFAGADAYSLAEIGGGTVLAHDGMIGAIADLPQAAHDPVWVEARALKRAVGVLGVDATFALRAKRLAIAAGAQSFALPVGQGMRAPAVPSAGWLPWSPDVVAAGQCVGEALCQSANDFSTSQVLSFVGLTPTGVYAASPYRALGIPVATGLAGGVTADPRMLAALACGQSAEVCVLATTMWVRQGAITRWSALGAAGPYPVGSVAQVLEPVAGVLWPRVARDDLAALLKAAAAVPGALSARLVWAPGQLRVETDVYSGSCAAQCDGAGEARVALGQLAGLIGLCDADVAFAVAGGRIPLCFRSGTKRFALAQRLE